MRRLRKKVFAAAGYNTLHFGPGRPEFDPAKPMPTFDTYLQDTAAGTCKQLQNPIFDEGVIGSFMSGRFIKQANLPGFLPFMVPSLAGKPCTGVEGACGTGGRAIATAIRSVLSDMSDKVFVAAFEMQNTLKPIYGADVLAGASYYQKERKTGHAFFFPGVFAERANAYYNKVGYDLVRPALAKWYEQAILNARKNPKAQEYHNTSKDLFSLGMSPPDPDRFIPYLNHYDCSKVTDGASSIAIYSEEGLREAGIDKQNCVEIIGIGEAEGDITQPPKDLTILSNTQIAVKKALQMADLAVQDIGLIEVHDCFTISGLLSIEALGLVKEGQAPAFIMEGQTATQGRHPVNLSGGLIGFGHPTGASGVRQLVDLWQQLTKIAPNQIQPRTPYGLMISMGGNDKTVTCCVVAI